MAREIEVDAMDLEERMDRYGYLAAIQARLRVPKGQRNDFGGYSYRNLEDINEALKPILEELGCSVTYGDEIKFIEGRHYVEAICALHTPSGAVETSAWARECEAKKGMDAAQITGSASSYARKYAACGMFALSGAADPDELPPETSLPEGRFDAKCRQCGELRHGFTTHAAETFHCPACGAIDWEYVGPTSAEAMRERAK